MALPFLPPSSSVATQDRLLYLLKLQNEKEIRKCPDNQNHPLLSRKNSAFEEQAGLSPVSSTTTSGSRGNSVDQTHAAQSKRSVTRTFRRLRRSKSADAGKWNTTATRRLWRAKQLEAYHLADGNEACSSGGAKKENSRSQGDEARTFEQSFRKSVSNDVLFAGSNIQPFSTANWPLRSQSLQEMQPGNASYLATTLFRRCSEMITNPFTLEFSLDPTKLAYPTALLSDALSVKQTSTKACASKELRVLDVGGVSEDSYIETLASIPTAHVVKATIKPKTNFSYPQHGTHIPAPPMQHSPPTRRASVVLVDRPWSLSLPTRSLDVVIARNLHKDIMPSMSRSLSSASTLDARGMIMKSLREFHRVLTIGGCVEYIYFERRLYNPGPLMEQVEPFLYENDRLRGEHSQQTTAFAEGQIDTAHAPGDIDGNISVEEFLELIEDAGFETKQKTVMMFPVQVLSALFTHEGHRRESTVSATTRTPEYRDGEDTNILKLFKRIQSECTASNPAWRLVVGWARKGAAPCGG